MELKKLTVYLFVFYALMGCAKQDFNSLPTSPNVPQTKDVYTDYSDEVSFPYSQAADFYTQDQFDKNKLSVTFQVIDNKGQNVSGLQPKDIHITENAQPITTFDLNKSDVNIGQKADIVFVFDITSSMQSTIDKAKTKVVDFVKALKAKNIEGHLCLVTFRDHTEKKCSTMIEDNPATASNENLDAFLDDLSKAKAKGGDDHPENQLRALIDTAKATAWRPNSQRISILITDEIFHFSPGQQGDAGNDAPTYEETIVAIKDAQMMVFTVGPRAAGYNTNFGTAPPLMNVVGGQFFYYPDLVKGKITMDSIFNAIIDRISTFYTAEYFAEDQASSVDATLPLPKRSITIQHKGSASSQVRIISAVTNWPQGRPVYKKKWKLNKKPRENGLNRVHVKINGAACPLGNFTLENDEVVFDPAPAPGAQIEIAYDPESLRDNVQVKALLLPANLQLETLRVRINGVTVGLEQLHLSRDSEGRLILEPAAVIFDEGDRFKIAELGFLKIEVRGTLKDVTLTKPL